jgi:hypothetical protein
MIIATSLLLFPIHNINFCIEFLFSCAGWQYVFSQPTIGELYVRWREFEKIEGIGLIYLEIPK